MSINNNFKPNYIDPLSGVYYDWEKDLDAYIAYHPDYYDPNDQFIYLYDPPPKTAVHRERKKTIFSNVADLLKDEYISEPYMSNKGIKEVTYNTEIIKDVKEIPTKIVSVPEPNIKKLSTIPVKPKPISFAEKEKKKLEQELEKEMRIACKEGVIDKRTLTRRLTRKMTVLDPKLSTRDQLDLIVSIKNKVKTEEINDQDINKRNAAEKAKEIALSMNTK